ncbi:MULTISPECIES: dihydroxyacetone kinase subunit DhaL [Vibrio]|jgi:dihydroxyacetone kinase-like protein|uniref:Dihydroxyacetone kinase subunit L n=2 Tax=Vibrio TaxID=662 RepID=A0A241TC43_9VIBR|nr:MULTISPECIES: dihydroxyacetone kinase subunit DhaL [Vibrio]ASI92732.1 dihydroxyacetone kinase subunit L [Vibrio mediterranei]AYV24762.1 dihydroxyacetone kinase subunit L [Vibrio mediterranei]EDL55574.1 dihydroxyacetone kinase, C-terminal domain [Vibrio mediterranei AK1]KFA97977.1 dihydroxyacetone kinase [Vibrio sp. ER1A]MCF4174268.1 dihydroxyacetone kinase ADP-binding subunit DhaL [Vibrio sp. McD22-P3]
MQIEKQHIINWLELCAVSYEENQDFLTDLDRDIGDADHGLNMNRGFKKVKETLPKVEKQNISTILKNTGMTLLSSVGGASGPLYGTLFIRTAASVGSRESLTFQELIDDLKSGVDGVISRGKAEQGDKTMCDVWLPVLNEMKTSLEGGTSPDHLLDEMVEVAEKSATSTIEMQAKKGRASYLGERSIGHQDPGATSSLLMIKALRQAIAGK